MGKIIAIGSSKGGPGKTTVTTNLAAALATAGNEVLIVDADSQPHSSSWGGRRAEARDAAGLSPDIVTVVKFGKIGADVIELSKKYDFVLVDVGGREGTELRQVLATCNLHIQPIRPSDYDTWTVSDIQEMIASVQNQTGTEVQSHILINAAPSNPMMRDHIEFRKELEDSFDGINILQTVLRDRAMYRRSVRPGKGVIDFAMHPQYENDNAIQEMKDLYREIFGTDWKPAHPEHMNIWGFAGNTGAGRGRTTSQDS